MLQWSYSKFRRVSAFIVPLILLALFVPTPNTARAASFPDAGFEDGTFTGWDKGSQSGNLGNTITGNGTGVTIFTGSRTFTHGSHPAVGNNPSSPSYAPAVAAGSWTFGPNNAAKAVALQPVNPVTFSNAMTALGLSGAPQTAIQERLTADGVASGNGNSNPTNAAWITREVQLTAGTTYTMYWNYLGTDYVPFNDGSVTGLVPVTVTGTPVIRVNNYVQSYALLGFTNPGTGDYSTNSYGATGWQTSTYSVDITGTYKLGFAVFNLGDTALSPVLMIDSEAGSTERCVSGTCTTFGGVASNSETAPTVPPTTTTTVAQTTTTSSTTTTSTTTTTIPAPTALEVTSLLDDGSSGTLRWAINQANANAGGIYDAIDITTEGTITLTSDLPNITAGVTITGTGMTTTIIDGNNLWRAIYNNGSRTIVIEDMTFKQGKNVSWNGGLIYNGSGTMTFNRIKISNHSSWAFYQGGGGVTTFNDSQFNNNGYAITSDHGGTPSALSLTDTNYSNRIYVNDSTFTSNTYGIRTERFVKINNSQFTGNTGAGAYLGGLNRQQVLNSTFTSNGVGVYLSSYIPTSWTPGAGNQTVSGNTFNGNTTAIQFANNWNNGANTYNGVSSNSFSTATGNTFGSTASNANNFSGSGYVESNNTITAAYLNPVTNLTAVANADGSVDLDWDASAASNCVIYGYSVTFYDLTVIGGATSGGWGVWTNQGTNYSLSTGMFSGSNPVTTGYGPVRFGIKAMTGQCAGVGTGSCTYGPEVTVDATVLDPTTTTSTTSTTTTTTTTVYIAPVDNGTTTTSTVPVVVVIPPVDYGTTTTSTVPVVVIPPVDTTVPLPEVDKPEPVATLPTLPVETKPEIVLPTITIPEDEEENPWDKPIGAPKEFDKLPDNATPTQIGAVIESVDFTEVTDKNFGKTVDAVFDNINKPEDVANVIGAFLEADVSDKQLDAVLDKVFDGPMTASQTTEILEGLLDGPVTATQLETIMDKVFEDISDTKNTIAVLGALLDGPLSKQELGSVMEAVFSEEATVTQMAAVVGDLLDQKLDVKELDAVFEAAFDGDLSDKETIDLIVDVLKEDLTSEALGSALGAVFDDGVSDEVLVETFTAVLGTELNKESVGVIVNVLESESISEAQVATVVTLIIQQEGGVDAEQATELATSSKVLESIDGSQATEVFAAVIVAEVTEEAGAAISEALTEAPVEVKESFEEEINVFAGVFDTYTALGSAIDVGTRRSVIAVNLVTSTVALASAAGAIPTPGSNSSPSTPRQDVAARREEEETEEGGAIEGDGPDWIKRISIYKYENGVRLMDWKNFAKKFIYGVMGSGFTLAGAVVMYFTLSGLTQQIALWGTTIAFACAMYLHMKESSDE